MTSAERHEARYQRRKAAREAKRRSKLQAYDNFDMVASPGALIRANFESRKGVMWKASVARYNVSYLKYSILQSRTLMSGRFLSAGFYSFVIYERGKRRCIHSLHYAERVVRRSVCINALVPILSSNLIYDNGASLKGKGVSFSAARCEAHLHEYFRETGSNEGYVLIVDFKGYFDHILHEPLNGILDRYLTDPKLNALCRGFVAAPDADKPDEERGMGLYIGPEDSQIYAVAYPNAIDHMIKDIWGIRYYGRYMDDSYIILRDKAELQRIQQLLFAEYAKVGIIPNVKKTQIVKLSRGFTFLKTQYFLTSSGAVVKKPDHSAVVRERRKLKKLKRFLNSGEMTLEQITQSYMSWRGALLKRDAYRSVCSMDALFFDLYGVMPWKNNKKRRNQYGRKTYPDHRGDQRTQVPA